jgi:hypothetical protein
MKAVVENVSVARNGQVVLRINGLDYWTNEGYLAALLSSKKLPADIMLLQGCELEFEKVSHKAGDDITDAQGKVTGKYKKDGQRFNRPSILTLGDEAKSFRTVVVKEAAKMSLKGSLAGLSFKKTEREAPADIRENNSVIAGEAEGDDTI